MAKKGAGRIYHNINRSVTNTDSWRNCGAWALRECLSQAKNDFKGRSEALRHVSSSSFLDNHHSEEVLLATSLRMCLYSQRIYSGRDAASRVQERCMNFVLAQWNSELGRDSFLRMRFLFAPTALLSTRGTELLGFDVLAVPFPVGIATLT